MDRVGVMPEHNQGLAFVLRAIRKELGMNQATFSAKVDASTRSLSRWEVDGDLPPPAQRTHIAIKLAPLVSTKRLAELVEALELEDWINAAALCARARPTEGRGASAGDIEAALFALAEDLDVGAGKVRPAVAKLLARLEATGLTLADLRAGLARPRRS